MAVTALGGRFGHGGQVSHLIAKEVLGPIRDVAVLVDLEFVDLGSAILSVDEIERHIVLGDPLFGDPSLDAVQQVLAVGFHDQLGSVVSDSSEEHVTERGLGGGVQVDLGLFQDDRCAGWRVEDLDQHWQNLGYAEADICDGHASGASGYGDSQLVKIGSAADLYHGKLLD